MASPIFSLLKPSSHETQRRRNRLRKVLLETLERRELLAADLLGLDDLGYQSTTTFTSEAYSSRELQFTPLTAPGSELSGYHVTNFLDQNLGGSPGSDLTSRPWFHMVADRYEQWSQDNGLAFSYSAGLVGEGEGLVGEGEPGSGGPRLLSVAPNSGDIFSFNNVNTLDVAPTELVFRFDGDSDLNPNTLANGIRVIRAGDNGVFDATDPEIEAGFLGLGDTNRIAVFRFATTLPDDLYRVELLGEGADAITNTAGVRLDNRLIDSTPNDTSVDTVDFRLELGALVQAVVPQPVDRAADGSLDPQLDKIRVYFNNDDLDQASAENPNFYQLLLTKDTVQPQDDDVHRPLSVSYDTDADMAELTFAQNIDEIAGGAGTFRLRIGGGDDVVSSTNMVPLNTLAPPDPSGTVTSAFDLGTLSSATNTSIRQSIVTTNPADLPLDYPGSNFETGHRDIQDESHLAGGPDGNPGITTAFYNFALDRSYGVNASGQAVFTSITPEQQQRVREIFELYSAQAGADFIESESAGITIVVGDLFPVGGTSAPGGSRGLSDTMNAISAMDGAEPWDNSFGGDFMLAAMHQIGMQLGLSFAGDLPVGTFMRANVGPGTPADLAFPGDNDVVHLQHLHRPDNRDVDLYRFEVPVGLSGRFTSEIIAERLANSSNLDAYLTLYQQNADGTLEVVSANDNYFGEDAFLDVAVSEGTYFLGVTSSGNEDYNPLIEGTGAGGTSQGTYELRFAFKPDAVASIVDTSGVALDGDGDGQAGGNFDFWFRTATPAGSAAAGAPKTIYVDKGYRGTHSGSPSQPFNNLDFNNSVTSNPAERWPAGFLQPGDIVRVVGSVGSDGDLATTNDNPAYEIGRGGVGNAVLSDGIELQIPREVTLMIDAGAIFKIQGSHIVAGSSSASIDNRLSSIQVLGTTTQSVMFTSYDDESLGVDTNPLPTVPQPGNWGGIEIRNDIDRSEGRVGYERRGIFLNYISNADIRYGGGRITIATPSPSVSPIFLAESRPTLINNRITLSADSAISADPNSFEATLFNEARYQQAEQFAPDYSRIGPDIRGNTVVENSINGLFVRIQTLAGNQLQQLTVAGRFNDLDITHVLGENLIIAGTPGGSVLETTAPNINLLQLQPTSGGGLTPGQTFTYRITFVDRFGGESIASASSNPTVVGAGGAIRLASLPAATGDFVGRRVWRSEAGGAGTYTLVAELDSGTAVHIDRGADLGVPLTITAALQRARPDASLIIDPGTIVKSLGSRIEVGIGAQLLAEGTGENKIIFTSRYDDRYGAGGTFDTNDDGTTLQPGPGDWGGLLARQLSTIGVDSAYVAFGGGTTSIPGGFAGFNAIEIHQATGRVVNSVFEENADGIGGSLPTRDGRGTHEASVIFVRAAQPVIMNNTFLDNESAVISIDANSMKAVPVQDLGRQTGANERIPGGLGNMGPLVKGNRLLGNSINGMEIRGATLTAETAWDDTDIVHVLRDEIVVGNFHSFGGIRLQSHVDESLVVKLAGGNAGITATGTPLDMADRIGGSVQIIGTPGFPVVLTSLSDDSVGAGFDPTGAELTDTNNNGPSTGTVGGWRSLLFGQFSNDRNLDTIPELETDQIQDAGTNDSALAAQFLGGVADNLNGGDENLRLGLTVHGVVASPSDSDVYSFTGTAGTPVWLDIDRTDAALDSVVELIDGSGRIIALSDNSLQESANQAVSFVDGSLIVPDTVQPMDRNAFAPPNSQQAGTATDFQSVNPADAGMRVVLPGTAGEQNTYFVRVRSSNVAPGQSPARLQDPALVGEGITTGAYRLQIRLQQQDEIAGSTVRYADIRFAQTGVDISGLPVHSPLLGNASESFLTGGGQITVPNTSTDLGNLATADRAAFSVSGEIAGSDAEVDFYQFSIARELTNSGPTNISATFDIDYASDFGRPNTTLWVYQLVGNQYRLVLTGTDSNIADDRPQPGQAGGDIDNLLRGSFGSKDAYIGTQELPEGNYIVAVSNNSRIAQEFRQFQEANPASPLVRVEPIDSIQRISVDRFEGSFFAETWAAPKQVAFSGNNLSNTNSVPFTLGDVSTFVIRESGNGTQTLFANAMTGTKEAELNTIARVNDIAMSPDGRLVAYVIPTGPNTDGNNGTFVQIDVSNNGATTTLGNSGLTTFTTEGPDGNGNYTIRQRDGVGDGILFNALSFFGTGEVTDSSVRFYGVGKRGAPTYRRALSDLPPPVGDDDPTTIDTSVTIAANANMLYRLDPTTGAAIQPAGVPLRAGNDRTDGAGTNITEYAVFATNDTITGLADIGNSMAAVSEAGELFIVPNPNDTVVGFISPRVTVRDNGSPVRFNGLSAGPVNLGMGDVLFGTTSGGTIYAFDIDGNLLPIFPGGNYKVSSGADNAGDRLNAGSPVSGIAFSPLDVNLWHQTNTQGTAAGHGRNETFDNSRFSAQNGTNSLYFGFEQAANDGAQRQDGSWDPIHSVFDGGYDLPGGAHGAIESLPVDLRGYSAEDLPTLYFTYYLDTENANSPLNDGNVRMRDAFRVYAAGDDGVWVEVVTNNSGNDGNFTNGLNELDSIRYADPSGLPLATQEAFDVGDNNAPDSWRQARVNLAPFAGDREVKIRFEFSTGATFRTGDHERGGVELNAVAGHRLADGQSFFITRDADIGGGTERFEFDMGLVLNLPGGSSLVAGTSAINFDGTPLVFGTDIPFNATDTPAQVAASVAAVAGNLGLNVEFNSERGNVLNITNAPIGTYSTTAMPAGTIQGTPGVASGTPVLVHQGMTTTEVRDAIRTSLAAGLNVAGQSTNVDVWPVYGNSTIRMFKHTFVAGTAPLSVASRTGDVFGVQNTAFTNMDERAQNNAGNVGVFIDDILIGLAERGEMVTNAPLTAQNVNGLFTSNLQYEQPGFNAGGGQLNEIERGRYQLEIRTSAEYGNQATPNFMDLGNPFAPSRSFDSNDRLSQQVGIQVASASQIADGTTVTLSDGIDQLTLEFDVTSGGGDPSAGIAAGNVLVALNASDSAAEVANKIRNAINSSTVQNRLAVSASVNGQLTGTDNGSGSNLVLLHGPAALTRLGGLTITGTTGLAIRRWGTESMFGEDGGDDNRLRDQGMILISSSTITNSNGFGVQVDAADRNVSEPSFPGAPIHYPTDNASNLAPGAVIMNNIIADNRSGGILISGDPNLISQTTEGDVVRPSTITRVVNNTIYGTRSGDAGIRVTENAAPIILNNIVANTSTAIDVGGANFNRVIGATLYHNNASQPTLAGESFRLVASSSPFVNAASGFFYPAPGSLAIDSSLEALPEVASLSQVKNSLSLPASPILAPDRDFTGQRRVDDFTVAPPGGLGANAFKDRGAVERADLTNMNAVILQPQDNDSLNVDKDRNTSYIRLSEGRLDFFSILLDDGDGVGPDESTVTASNVVLTENGSLLIPGVDYVFGFNSNSRTIRLTPLAGIWRNDSVYEITLNNKNSLRLNMPAGDAYADGQRITVNYPGGSLIYEFDDDDTVGTGATAFPFDTNETAYEVAARLSHAINSARVGVASRLEGDGSIMIDGATSVVETSAATVTSVGAIRDLAGNTLFPNRATGLTQFTIVMPEASEDYGDADGSGMPTLEAPTNVVSNGNGARHALLPIDVPLLALGSFADADADGQPTSAVNGDDNDSLVILGTLATQGPAGPATLVLPPAAGLDNQSFVITDTANRPFAPITFEFDTNSSATSSATRVVVDLNAGDNPAQVAAKLAAAVNGAVLNGQLTGLTAVADGAVVSLGGSASDSIDLTLAPIVGRLAVGNVDAVIPATFADGQTLTIIDGAGNSRTFELDNIDPTAGVAGVALGNVPVEVDFTTADSSAVAAALAAAINADVAARNLLVGPAVANGDTVSILADDEDGVTFEALFNSASNPVPITVTSTGSGMLDAWIDWNADGDFNDSGEKLFAASTPVLAGDNVFDIQTPAGAAVGFTTARFRLSTLGGLLANGIGIGGEVEDYLIEIVAGDPPIGNSDSYTVDEDVVLAVADPALGVLANDTDANVAIINPGVNIFVYDEDPATPEIEPLIDVSNGTLVLNRDGTFTYTPDLDFNGTDSFVYNVTDERLIGNVPVTVTITVNPINDSPLAIDDERSSLEDQAYIRNGIEFTANDLRHNLGHPSEDGQALKLIGAEILSGGGVVSVANNVLTYIPAPHYNSQIGGPVLLKLTIEDDGTAGPPAALQSSSTLTLTLAPVNDSPEFSSLGEIRHDEDFGPVVLPNFFDGRPGPVLATDEDSGPANVPESQTISYTATALNADPALYKTLPTIDASGTLSYELADDVNTVTPFPALLVEVIASDTGVLGNTSVLINQFDPNNVFPAAPNMYDGATLTVIDSEGNTLILELEDDVNLPGVGSTAGFPHAAVLYDATDDVNSLNQKIVAAINSPPAGTVNPGAAGPWSATAYVDTVSNEIKFTKVASTSSNAPQAITILDNQFPALASGTTYDGATFTITDTNGDRVTFEFNDIANVAPAAAGVTLGNVAIDYDSGVTTQNELSQAIAAAINNPPASSIFEVWDVVATLPVGTDRLELSGVSSVSLSPSIASVVNPLLSETKLPVFVQRFSNESTSQTITILPESINDAPFFNLGTTPVTLEDEGLIRVPAFMTDIRRGPVTALDELVQTLSISYVYADSSAFEVLPTIDLLTGDLTYKTASNANRANGDDFGVTVTITDNGGTARGGVNFYTDSFTIDVLERNDAPEFDMPSAISNFQEVVPDPSTPVVVPGFVTNQMPGPATAGDEVVPENQTVSFRVKALNESLFSILPTIDANGELQYRLADDVNDTMPFPTILVEVIGVDTGTIGNGSVVINHFDPSHVAPFTPNIFDGATLTVVDNNGNTVVFELDDTTNFPGVGSTAGFPHVAIPYDATDSVDTLNERIANAIDNPPLASIDGPGGWTVNAYADAFSHEIRFTGETSVVTAAPAGVTILNNLFPALGAGESYDGATFTLTDIDGDSITFEFNDTSGSSPGVSQGNVAIDYDPSFTSNQLSSAINGAINNPPAGLAAAWDVVSTLPGGTDRLELSNVVNVKLSASTATSINPLTSEIVSQVFTERLANESAPRTFTIVPDPINDAPEFTITNPALSGIKEDQGDVTIPGFIVDARPGPITALDELALQQITFTLIANEPEAFYNYDDALPEPNGLPKLAYNATTDAWDLTFRTAKDVNKDTGHDLGVRVVLMDDGGVRPGTPDVDTTEQTFTMTLDPINDAPTFVTNPTFTQPDGSTLVTVLEDNEDFPPPGATPTVIPGFAVFTVGPNTAIDETTAQGPPAQTAAFNTLSVSNPGLFEVTPVINANGDLVFTTMDNQNGSSVVVVRMNDSGVGVETGEGDDNQARPDRTFTITLTPINDHPEFTIAKTATSIEDQGLVQIPGFLEDLRNGPLSASDETGQEFTVRVAAVDPTVVFTVPPEITADGTLRYQTGPDVNNNNADLRVRVWLEDDGAQGPAPNNHISPEQTFLLNVTPINDAPLFTLPNTLVTVDEDSGPLVGGTNFATSIQVGPTTASDEEFGSTADPALGRTTLPAQTTAFEVVSVSAPELFSVQPSISPAGTLTFTPGTHKNGNAVVVVRLVDSGPSAPPPNDNDSSLQTFTISITPVNDAPVFELPPSRNITVIEDAGLVSQNGFATNVRRGPVGTDDENNQTIRFDVVAVDKLLFAVQPSIGVDGTLVFQTAPHVNTLNANGQLLVNVKLVDNGPSAPPPNDNESDVQQFTITVTPVNDDPIPNEFMASTTEDTPITIQAIDVIGDDAAGPTSDETDGSQLLRMSQIERTTARGGLVTPVFSGTGSTAFITNFTYTPPQNLVGPDFILYVVTDDGIPNRSGTGTITISLDGVNDPPQFVRGSNQIVPEDSDTVVVDWATQILAGPPSAADENDGSQTVNFSVSGDTSLFEIAPTISTDGKLTFKPSANVNGTAVLSVVATDTGVPPASSAAQQLTISVTAVNDAPVFTPGGNVSVAEDSGAYSQPWATNIAPAAGLLDNPQTATDEVGQVVDFNVSVDLPGLFSVQPTVSSSGILAFTPTENAFGQAVVTVTAVDRGPAGGLNQNSSQPSTLTVTLTPVNDAPVAVNDEYSTDENSVLPIAASGLLANDTDVDLPSDTLTAVPGTYESDFGATVRISSDGSFTYDPLAVTSIQQLTSGQNVLDSFTYQIQDALGLTSQPATVFVNVSGIDDAPVAMDDAYSIGVNQSRFLDVLVNDTDIDSAIDVRTIAITQVPVFGEVIVNQTGVVQYIAGNGFRGVDSFGYTVSDLAGNVSNEAIVRVTVNNAPVANNDTTFTFKNESVDINVLSNDSDVDGSLDPSTVEVVITPTPGGTTEVLPGGVIRFTPETGFSGQAQFSYVVADDVGTTSNVANVLVRVQNSKWQNPQGSLDVNADGFVSPIDALLIINYLNSGAETFLPSANVTPPPYLDPSGDESVSALDVLLVLNFLNARSGGAAEGESTAAFTADYAMMVTPEQILQTVGDEVVREVRSILDESRMRALGSATVGPNVGAAAFLPENDEEEDSEIVEMLSCSTDEFEKSSLEDAVDDFFSNIGPFRPM